MTVDRYIAIMRPYAYIETVTKTRFLIAIALDNHAHYVAH